MSSSPSLSSLSLSSPGGSFHHSELRDPPSSHHHHPCRLSHPNSVVQWLGSQLPCTAGSLAAQFLPWDHRYRTKMNARRYVEPFPSCLFADWSDWLDPWRHGGCPNTNCSFGSGFCQTFTPYMNGRLPTTPEKPNTSFWGVAPSGGIVKRGDSWLDQERL